MSSKSCAADPSVVLRLDLWAVVDATSRQIYAVTPTTGSGASVMGTPVTIRSVGRSNGACAAYAAEGSASQCGDTTALMGDKAGPGATQWIIDAVKGQPGMVYIHNQVCWTGRRLVGSGWFQGTSALKTRKEVLGPESSSSCTCRPELPAPCATLEPAPPTAAKLG